MRLLDPAKTVTVREATEYGSVTRTEHFNGSVDANVQIRGLRLHVTAGAPPDRYLVAAVAELEAASREWRLAKNTGLEPWKLYAAGRLRDANDRLREVQR